MTRDELFELGVIRTATPCPKKWADMRGDAVKRFCDDCQLNVYDVSQLTTLEAYSLLKLSEGRVCARIYTRADGTVLTRDCPTGLRRARQRALRGALALGALATAGLAAVLSQLGGGPSLQGARLARTSERLSRQAQALVTPVLRSSNPPRSDIAGGMRPPQREVPRKVK
jgi:hypothetical protein